MRSAFLGYYPVVQSGNPLSAVESNCSVAYRGESFDSDPVVRLARVNALSWQGAVQRSTSTVPAAAVLRRLAETHRRIDESKDRIRRTDRLLRVIEQEIVFKPVQHNSASHLYDDSVTLRNQTSVDRSWRVDCSIPANDST